MSALPPLRACRTDLQRLQDQLDNLCAWQAMVRTQREADLATVASEGRERRLDARRRLDGLQRAESALRERADVAIRSAPKPLRGHRPAMVVIAHRNEWLRNQLTLALVQEGADVVAVVEDGGDAVGIAVADQPDLLVVEDRLPTVTGLEVVQQVRRFAPHTIIAAQVEATPPGELLAAGASAVFSRRIPPAVIAEQMAAYVRAAAEVEATEPLVLT